MKKLINDPFDAVDEMLVRARAAGVAWMVCVGTDLATSLAAIEIAGRHEDVYATVGLHPHDASKLGAQWSELEPLARDERVVGIGEAGFDLYYEHSPRDEQETAFRMQVRLGMEQSIGRRLMKGQHVRHRPIPQAVVFPYHRLQRTREIAALFPAESGK